MKASKSTRLQGKPPAVPATQGWASLVTDVVSTITKPSAPSAVVERMLTL